MARRKRTRTLSLYDLIDWTCPRYEERKPGSTEYGSTILCITPLVDGRFVWQTAYTRKLFKDGSPADWWLGIQPVSGPEARVVGTFQEALTMARQQLTNESLPQWAN